MNRTKPDRPRPSVETPPKESEDDLVNLSEESINDRSTAKTEVLNEMLERERKAYNLRYWGINE